MISARRRIREVLLRGSGTQLLIVLACACSSAAGHSSALPPTQLDGSFSNPSGLLHVSDAAIVALAPPQTGPCQTTFQAIQETLFDGAGCTSRACHTLPGPDTPAAGLDLTAGHAYHDLVGVRASTALEPALLRIAPGDELSSFLYLKVAAAEASGPALPAGGGAPMPLGLPPLAASALQALRAWIRAGAPETGIVPGTQALVDACQRSDD